MRASKLITQVAEYRRLPVTVVRESLLEGVVEDKVKEFFDQLDLLRTELQQAERESGVDRFGLPPRGATLEQNLAYQRWQKLFKRRSELVDEFVKWWKERYPGAFSKQTKPGTKPLKNKVQLFVYRLRNGERDAAFAELAALQALGLEKVFGADAPLPKKPKATVKTLGIPIDLELEGFRVTFSHWDPKRAADRDARDYITLAFRRFRQRTTRVFPWLIQHFPPIKVNFQGASKNAGTAGLYWTDAGKIEVYANVMIKAKETDQRATKTIAHECGHFVWQRYLSPQQRTFWNTALRNSKRSGRLNLADLLAAWPAGQPLEAVIATDPEMYLQARILMTGWGRKFNRYPGSGGDFHGSGARGVHKSIEPLFKDRAGLEKEVVWRSRAGVNAVAKPGGSLPQLLVVDVPARPITAYANTNPEEAFCEAFGLLVAYGPRTLHPEIQQWLSVVLPTLKLESLAPVESESTWMS